MNKDIERLNRMLRDRKRKKKRKYPEGCDFLDIHRREKEEERFLDYK